MCGCVVSWLRFDFATSSRSSTQQDNKKNSFPCPFTTIHLKTKKKKKKMAVAIKVGRRGASDFLGILQKLLIITVLVEREVSIDYGVIVITREKKMKYFAKMVIKEREREKTTCDTLDSLSLFFFSSWSIVWFICHTWFGRRLNRTPNICFTDRVVLLFLLPPQQQQQQQDSLKACCCFASSSSSRFPPHRHLGVMMNGLCVYPHSPWSSPRELVQSRYAQEQQLHGRDKRRTRHDATLPPLWNQFVQLCVIETRWRPPNTINLRSQQILNKGRARGVNDN